MLHVTSQATGYKARNFWVGLASSPSEVVEAQKLRYRVFGEEMGARLATAASRIDQDRFDKHCKHLIVSDEAQGRIVGTYRILTPEAAYEAGGYYSETEFDLTRMLHLRDRMVEVGRSCIDAEYRNGSVIALLWSGLSNFMQVFGYEYLMGCASVCMKDGGHNAANLYMALQDKMAAPEYHAFPHNPLPVARLVNDIPAEIPPLLKGYLRAGAKVCGSPAWDPDFNTADMLILLQMARVDARYVKHFIERRGA